MATFKAYKTVSSLPSEIEADSVYLVRTGHGFDLYVSDSTGAIAHKINNNTGFGSTPLITGMNVHANGQFDIAGDAQNFKLVTRRLIPSSSDSWHELTTNGNAPTINNRLAILEDTLMWVDCEILGLSENGMVFTSHKISVFANTDAGVRTIQKYDDTLGPIIEFEPEIDNIDCKFTEVNSGNPFISVRVNTNNYSQNMRMLATIKGSIVRFPDS